MIDPDCGALLAQGRVAAAGSPNPDSPPQANVLGRNRSRVCDPLFVTCPRRQLIEDCLPIGALAAIMGIGPRRPCRAASRRLPTPLRARQAGTYDVRATAR